MAQRVQVLLVDDLDGTEAVETVNFGLDGVSYEIDLSSENATTLRDALAAYVGSGRRIGGRRKGRGNASGAGASPAEVREWAREHGWELSDRGRVPADVRDAYDAAH